MTRRAVALILILAASAGCSTVGGYRDGPSDGEITAAVKMKFVTDANAKNLFRIAVDTNDSIVYLNGMAISAEIKGRAEKLARETRGVKAVVNNLQLSSEIDIEILAAAKSRMIAKKLYRVDVDVVDGIVYLAGSVDTLLESVYATEAAWKDERVRSVINRLRIGK